MQRKHSARFPTKKVKSAEVTELENWSSVTNVPKVDINLVYMI